MQYAPNTLFGPAPDVLVLRHLRGRYTPAWSDASVSKRKGGYLTGTKMSHGKLKSIFVFAGSFQLAHASPTNSS